MALNAIVRTNITAVNAHRQLSGAGLRQAKASEQLASGKRINSAADDVAGLGIVQKMRTQVVGLDRASLNAQDAMSLVQTAEGALSSIGEMLIRVRELVTQAANDTNVHDPDMLMQSDRSVLQAEIEQIMFEINNIAYRTEFNTRTLLDGSLHQNGVVGGAIHSIATVQTNNPAQITTLDQFLRTTANMPFVGSFAELLTVIGADLGTMNANQWIAIHAGANFGGLAEALDVAMGVPAGPNGPAPGFAGYDPDPPYSGALRPFPGEPTSTRWEQLEISSGLSFRNATDLLNSFVQGLQNPNALRAGDIRWNAPQQGFDSWADFITAGEANPDMGASTFAGAISNAGGQTIYQALRENDFAGLSPTATFSEIRNVFYKMDRNPNGGWGPGINDDIADALADWLNVRGTDWETFVIENLTADTDLVFVERWVADETLRERGTALWFQLGANGGQGIHVGINSVTTRSLGEPIGDLMDLIDVENSSGRPISEQVDFIDHALTRVNRERAYLGAVHNRLEFAREGLDLSSENLTASMSRIRDADMAKAMMEFYSANALTQAATAMIAHANQSPQAVLELLQ